MPWQFILTDLQGVPHGELHASERRVSDPWMRVPTASCSMPLSHPLAQTAMDTDCLLRCYRTDAPTGTRKLVFHGPVISAEESGDSSGQVVGISAAGPYWRLQKRLLGVTKAGIEFGTVAAPLDLSTIGRNIVDAANGRGETGIATQSTPGSGATWTATGQSASTGKYWLKPAAEALTELAGGLNSFEWRVRPIEPVAGGGFPRIALIDFAPETTFRVDRPDSVYEYGTTRANVGSYKRTVSRETMINRALISVSGWPDTPAAGSNGVVQDLITVQDAAQITARGLLEEVVSENGVIDAVLRTQIANTHLLYRKRPRQQIMFSPAPDSRPVPYVDYGLGENIRARAVVNGTTRFDALFRVYGISFEISAEGAETVELELVEPSS